MAEPQFIILLVLLALIAIGSCVSAVCWVLFYLRLGGVPLPVLDFEIRAFKRRRQKRYLGM